MGPRILIIGAGKSATVLIQYLQKKAVENDWYILLADGDVETAKNKFRVDSSLYFRQKNLWSQQIGTKVDFELKESAAQVWAAFFLVPI